MAGDLDTSAGPAADARRLGGAALAAAWRAARATVLARVDDLDDDQWRMPRQPCVNPVAWELAHLAWFGEFWVLRGPHRAGGDGLVHAARPPRIAGPDALLDSARLPHACRWDVALPSRVAVRALLDAQLEACLAALPADDEGDAALYAHRLALLHEEMHAEALAWMRAALGYPAPAGVALPAPGRGAPLAVPGGRVTVGWPPGRRGFAFDNEQPATMLELPAFEIDAVPVSAGAYREFVEAGGYDEPALWPHAAARWRAEHPHPHPARWRRGAHGWETRWFDRWAPLDPARPVVHVCAWEAEAYARWAGRRLPRAAEWEHAATGAATRAAFAWGGGVWEWTADPFLPYPGFAPGPYRDYSAPWFGDHRELRGGSCATGHRLHDPRFRNFFLPGRTDVFAGFRTAADPR